MNGNFFSYSSFWVLSHNSCKTFIKTEALILELSFVIHSSFFRVGNNFNLFNAPSSVTTLVDLAWFDRRRLFKFFGRHLKLFGFLWMCAQNLKKEKNKFWIIWVWKCATKVCSEAWVPILIYSRSTTFHFQYLRTT